MFADSCLNPIARSNRDSGFVYHHHELLFQVFRDGFRRQFHITQVSVAITERRRVHRDKNHILIGDVRFSITSHKAHFWVDFSEKGVQVRFINGWLTCLQSFYLFLVEVDARDIVAQVSQHHPRIQTYISSSNNKYSHSISFSFLFAQLYLSVFLP